MEEKIYELEERIKKLEKKEKRRTIISVVKIIIYIVAFGVLAFVGYKAYTTLYETIEPYKEVIDNYNETNTKIKSITDLFK